MYGWTAPARAGDLGADDLETRVAELEATAVRKGNRKVSVELSGQVDRALLFWNDGRQSDVYNIDNSWSSTRFRMKGTADMAPGWKAGFYQELEFRDAASNTVFQGSETGGRGTDSSTGSLRLRQSNAFVESQTFGRVTLGLQSAATKDLTLTNLGGGTSDPENYYATNFRLRGPGGNTISGLVWNNLSNALDALRLELVRYDTPSIYGFILSASWGQNDFWDIALRYQKEWNSIRVAAGIGYAFYGEQFTTAACANNTSVNGVACPDGTTADQIRTPGPWNGTSPPGTKTQVISGTLSVMHVPTGIYVTFDAGTRSLTNPRYADLTAVNKDANYFYIQAGVTKRFFDIGQTTVYGDFGQYQNFGFGDTAATLGLGATGAFISDDTAERWGVGFTQAYDRAAMEFYANFYHYSVDITMNNGTKPKVQDWDAVLTGARLKF